VSPLRISVTAGETGPVVTLSGEADLSTAAELSEVLTHQVSSGSQHLTVDISELSFADSASVRTLVLAGRAMKDRGGALKLTNP
jgi:anti-anti-sigma factor